MIVPVSAFAPVPGVKIRPAGRPVADSQALSSVLGLSFAVTVTEVLSVKPGSVVSKASEVNFGALEEGVTLNATVGPLPFELIARTVPDTCLPFVKPSIKQERFFASVVQLLEPIWTL